VGALFVLLLIVATPATALGHAELETSSPAAGDVVDSPFEGPIVLNFTEALADGSEADLLGPDGSTIGAAIVDGPEAQMTIELDGPLDPGEYEIQWTGIAADGHVERGTFTFSVAPPAATPTPTPEATPTPEPSASATPTPASPSPQPTPSPSPTPDSATAGTADVLIPIIVALVLVVGGGAYLLTRRRGVAG
jgi:hypothetical protein